MQRVARMKRELQLFEQNPPHGISCWGKDDSIENLEAQILGPDGSPYAGGVFRLEIQVPERYPFEPPKIKYTTPIYHPNIDTAGRICLDSLKMPPKGAWKPALNISTLLTSIQLLMNEPNPDDPLMTEIANEFKYNKPTFEKKANEWTQKYAKHGEEIGESDQRDKENIVDDEESDKAGSSGTDSETSTAKQPITSTHEKSTKKRTSDQSQTLLDNVKRSKYEQT